MSSSPSHSVLLPLSRLQMIRYDGKLYEALPVVGGGTTAQNDPIHVFVFFPPPHRLPSLSVERT